MPSWNEGGDAQFKLVEKSSVENVKALNRLVLKVQGEKRGK